MEEAKAIHAVCFLRQSAQEGANCIKAPQPPPLLPHYAGVYLDTHVCGRAPPE